MSDEPILKIKASRITGSNRVFPSEIRVYDDRVEEHKPGPLRQRNQGIRFNQVAQVSIRRGIPWATLTIESTGGHMISVGGLSRSDADRAKAEIQARLGGAVVDDEPDASVTSTSATDELARLAAMKEQGLLTDEEFAAAKKSLLGL